MQHSDSLLRWPERFAESVAITHSGELLHPLSCVVILLVWACTLINQKGCVPEPAEGSLSTKRSDMR